MTDTAHYAKVRAALSSQERLREARVMLVDGEEQGEEQGAEQGVVTLVGVCSRGQGGILSPSDMSPESPLLLPFSSGTTGRPKAGIIHIGAFTIIG